MKAFFLPAILTAVVFSSCSVAYQSGQTPDDVYYSPQKESVSYVRAERVDNGENYYSPSRYSGSNGSYYNYDDRYLRMKVRNRYMWSDLDQWYYFNRPYYYSPYMSSSWGLYSPWNNYWAWNSFYNPYSYGYGFMGNYYFNRGVAYNGITYGSIKNSNYRQPVRPIVFNQDSYRPNTRTNNTNSMYGRYNNRNNSGYNNSNNVGRSVREVFNNNNSNGRNNTGYQPSNNNNNNSNNRPVRTYTPSSSGSSSSGSRSSGSSSSSPSRPSRGGGR